MAWPSGKAEACKASIPSSNLGATFPFSLRVFMLYIVATPIGNLSDMTYRAVETLKSCDYILCEDTRHSITLLNHYFINKPLKSLHKFNEVSKIADILEDLRQGVSIALISDAGTPGISDPGTLLVQACVDQNIAVCPIPGPCAAIAALCCSGLDTDRFQFYGFLPKKEGALRRSLQEILAFPGTTICYESPNRLLKVLEILLSVAPERHLVIARELTKKFEEFHQGTPLKQLDYWKKGAIKGEIVLMFSKVPENASFDWEELSPEDHVTLMMDTYNLSRQEAIKSVAKIRGVSKRNIYNTIHND